MEIIGPWNMDMVVMRWVPENPCTRVMIYSAFMNIWSAEQPRIPEVPGSVPEKKGSSIFLKAADKYSLSPS